MPMAANDMSPKPVWLITGCSTGLGAALAKQVLQSGHYLVATARNPKTLSHLPSSSDTLILSLDVTSKPSVSTAFTTALQRFGRIDYVVNNAGYGIFAEAEGTEEQEARQIFETNFWGSTSVGTEAVRVFREGKGGMLIQISSLLGQVGAGGQSYYSASKFAIEGFIESLSKELHPNWNIKVLIAEPGAIKGTAFNNNICAKRDIHLAYRDADCPTNKTRQWLASPTLEYDFPPAAAMAKTLFNAVVEGGLPLRLPLGKDSWGSIRGEAVQKVNLLDKWRVVSESPAAGNKEV